MSPPSQASEPPPARWLLLASAALAAGLLFLLEPYFGRLLLPRLGGSAGVWTTCLCFFQGALLLGYLLAHAAQRLSLRGQAFAYLALLGLGALALPIGLPPEWAPDAARPVPGLVWALTRYLGIPFVALAAASPLLQALATREGGRAQGVLAASNAGSLLGLLAYPLLFEPLFDLGAQARGWGFAYAALWLLALFVFRGGDAPAPTPTPTLLAPETPPAEAPGSEEVASSPLRWLGWAVLAGVPAALLYAVTTTLSTFFPPLPLLWVLPLALYLGGMALAFARARGGGSGSKWVQGLVALSAAALLVSAFLLPALARRPAWLLAALGGHLAGFGLVA
ncbi:MAG: ferrichrome ABC transporter permease, partial [Planctomycetes bacterium]|nr:ferrichrome ABC transporter permease [Planctomycetota bacterium]